MWGDASIIGHWAAERDPLRWSSWASIPATIKTLRGYITKDRPIEMSFKACGYQWQRTFTNAADAIESLQMEMRSRIWKREMPPHEFNPHLSESLAYVSAVAYERDGCHRAIQNWTCEKCLRSGLKISGSGRQFGGPSFLLNIAQEYWGFVAKLQDSFAAVDSCVVAFRGAIGPSNALDGAFELLVEVPADWHCPSCRVHYGWFEAWSKLEAQVVAAMTSNSCTNAVITGHGMGGALATLGAWVLKNKHNFTLEVVYTFESPRVGDSVFAQSWDSSIAKAIPAFRVTYAKDPWINYPCQWGAYEHVQYETHFEPDGSYFVNPYREVQCGEEEALAELVGDAQANHCNVPYMPVNMCEGSSDAGC